MKKRPLDINPFGIRLPINALVSISHRLSGLFLFLLIPALIYSLDMSLASPDSFDALMRGLQKPIIQFIKWLALVSLVFHGLAGIRHLAMDMHWGDSLAVARITSFLVMLLTAIFAIGWFLL